MTVDFGDWKLQNDHVNEALEFKTKTKCIQERGSGVELILREIMIHRNADRVRVATFCFSYFCASGFWDMMYINERKLNKN